MSTSITEVAIGLVNIKSVSIDTTFAGRALRAVGGKTVPTVQNLYGPGRVDADPKKPETAFLATLALPNPLPAGAYSLHVRYQGDTDFFVVPFNVNAKNSAVGGVSTIGESDGNVGASIPKPLSWGFDASDADNLPALIIASKAAKADGAEWIRIWHTGFGVLSSDNIAIIAAAKSIGLKVILCQNVKDGGSRNLGTADAAGFASKNAAVLADVTYIEVGNELNSTQFRPDDLGSNDAWHLPYVTRWLSPMNKALPGKVLATSITDTWSPATYTTQYGLLKTAGAFNNCAGVAIHLYPTPQFAIPMFAAVASVKAMIGALPLLMTEGNAHDTECPNDAAYAAQTPVFANGIRNVVSAAVFYRGLPASATGEKFCLFNADGSKSVSYAAVLAGAKA